MARDIQAEIQAAVDQNEVIVFMKGSPSFPQCGFSARVVSILEHYGTPFVGVNVLADPEVREGVKAFSQWPTIPQLYVRGKFVGGCDIATELHESGELEGILKGSAADA